MGGGLCAYTSCCADLCEVGAIYAPIHFSCQRISEQKKSGSFDPLHLFFIRHNPPRCRRWLCPRNKWVNSLQSLWWHWGPVIMPTDRCNTPVVSNLRYSVGEHIKIMLDQSPISLYHVLFLADMDKKTIFHFIHFTPSIAFL